MQNSFLNLIDFMHLNLKTFYLAINKSVYFCAASIDENCLVVVQIGETFGGILTGLSNSLPLCKYC